MARYDMKSEILQSIALNSQTISSDTTTAGTDIDMQGYNSLTFILQVGTVTLGDVTPLIQDSDDDITYADVTDTFLSGTEAAALLDTSNTTSRIGYVGKKRYVRFSVVTANSADLTIAAIAVQGKGDIPTS